MAACARQPSRQRAAPTLSPPTRAGYNMADNKGTDLQGGGDYGSWHGTHCSGTVAAASDNRIGVAGVAGGGGGVGGAKLMILNMFRTQGVRATGAPAHPAAAALVYAADNGAVIASNSWTNREPGV